MSVYKPKGSETYVYDFQYRRNRFSGKTGTKIKREAEQVEREKRDEVRREALSARNRELAPMTLNVAFDRYWIEAGQHAKNPGQVEWSFDYLLNHFGENKLLKDITDADVATLVANRRCDRVDNFMVRKHAGKRRVKPTVAPKEAKTVSPATVNRSVIEPLRRVMFRARDVWQTEIGAVRWRLHKQKEPNERVRSLSADEEIRLFEALPVAYRTIVLFALRTGCRVMECINLRWSDIDWGNRRLSILGKGGKIASIPLSIDVRDLLFPLRTRETEYVFMMQKDASSCRISYRALYSAFRVASHRADISALRIHDLRHTAATRLVAKTGNLKMAQRLLRHENISTTAKYAHVLDDDLRRAMDDMAPREVPLDVPRTKAKPLFKKK